VPVVLDASALLAFLRDEPGGSRVAVELGVGAAICTVNLSEVIAVLVRDGMPPSAAAAQLQRLSLDIVDFNYELAVQAAALIRLTRPFGLAFGDRACLAVGIQRSHAVMTADRVWAHLPAEIGATIELIRQTPE
jgi:PIN domain nuclease of toxin-antitoxin system